MLDASVGLEEGIVALSDRTTRQAATLEETTGSLAVIAQAVRETTQSIGHAREIADEARRQAERSGEAVRRACTAMGRISSSSVEIGDIVAIIDGIASQTNLLSLNAAIEAARAGEAGRGFSIVAQEVRLLAQGTAAAADRIKGLVEMSAEHVTAGVDAVDDTGGAFGDIIEKVQRLNGVLEAISLSATDQASGLDSICVSVNDLDRVTQENAAMVAGSMAATRSVADRSIQIERLASATVRGGRTGPLQRAGDGVSRPLGA